MTVRGKSARVALVVVLSFVAAAGVVAQGKTVPRDTMKPVVPRRPPPPTVVRSSRQPPPPTVVRPSRQPPLPTVVRPSQQPPPPTVVRPSRQPPPPTVVRPSRQPPPPTVVQPSQPPPPSPTVVASPQTVADTNRPPSLWGTLRRVLQARAESTLSQNPSAAPAADTARPEGGCGAGAGSHPVEAGPLELYSIKYSPAESLLAVSLAVDTGVMRAPAETLLLNVSVRIADAAGRSTTMNLFNFRLADVKYRFTPRDSSRSGVVLTFRWNGRDRAGEPLGGSVRAGYKVSLIRVQNGTRSFVGHGAFGSVALRF
jgi:hypothetical protein